MGLFSKLKEGLTKTRDNIVSGIDSVFSGFSSIDDDFYEELEETMIMGACQRRRYGKSREHSSADPRCRWRTVRWPD